MPEPRDKLAAIFTSLRLTGLTVLKKRMTYSAAPLHIFRNGTPIKWNIFLWSLKVPLSKILWYVVDETSCNRQHSFEHSCLVMPGKFKCFEHFSLAGTTVERPQTCHAEALQMHMLDRQTWVLSICLLILSLHQMMTNKLNWCWHASIAMAVLDVDARIT